MQLQHQVEEALTGYLALQLTGVRVGIAQQTATLAGRRGEENPRGPVTAGLDPEHGNLVALFGLDPAHQLRHRQHAFLAHLDGEHLGIEQLQQFILE
ncbi:hypothetical protein D9M71_511700 [compost metagenome]